jgi:hypothetical protein
MVCRTGLWKAILFAAVTAVLTHGAPASARITIENGASATFAWTPASGEVAGYDVFVDRVGKPTSLYSTVFGRNWETVTAAANETITVRVVAFNSSGESGESSSSSEAVVFVDKGVVADPTPSVYGQAADFDSDGVSDMVVQSKRGYLEVTSMSTGNSTLLVRCKRRSNGTSKCKTVKMRGKRWMIVGNGDYDGDGVTDILFRKHKKGVQRKTKKLLVFYMDGDRVREISKLRTNKCVKWRNGSTKCKLKKAKIKKSWQIVGSGDYNGDGRSDILLHNATENKFDLWTMKGGSTYESEILPDDFGNTAEVIASGDFDGDGMSDILWRDLDSGEVDIWGLTKSSTLGPLEGGGDPWSAIGAGDFDGDGSDDVLLREADTDRLALRLSTTGARDVIQSALNQGAREHQVPSIGDYDGDGRTDLVLYDGEALETQLWLMNGSVVTASKLLPSPLDTWDFATTDLRPPGSR